MYYELYIDEFFLENLFLDFLLLLLTGLVGKLPIRWKRLACSAFAGSLWACLFVAIPVTNKGLILLSTAAVSAFMVKWGFAISKGRGRMFWKSLLVFYGMTFVLGGLLLVMDSRITFPVVLSGTIGTLFVVLMLRFLEKWKYETQNIYEVTLVWNGMQKELLGLRDTGNQLCDPYFGKPVTVVEYDAVKELFNQKTKVLWIPYHTVGETKGWMPGIRLDAILLEHDGEKRRIESPMIAVSKEKLSVKGRYQMILPSALTDD